MLKTRPLIIAFALFAAIPQAHAAERVEVFKSPYCGCCEKWVEHMRKAGFDVVTKDVNDVPAARKLTGMPERFGSCHTAKVGGYVVEGHVPAADVQRLLKEKPKAVGLAAPVCPKVRRVWKPIIHNRMTRCSSRRTEATRFSQNINLYHKENTYEEIDCLPFRYRRFGSRNCVGR